MSLTGTDTPAAPGTDADAGGLTLGDADPTIASLENVYLDGTLVLVAGHADEQRDPSDSVALHEAVVGPDEQIRNHGPEGPAWRARDLYEGPLFNASREFAETVTAWASDREGWPWAVLSAGHGVLPPWEPATVAETGIEDLGGDELNPDHHVEHSSRRRRPDGREIVTERDKWAARVATDLARWLAGYRENDTPDDAALAQLNDVNEDEDDEETARGFVDLGEHSSCDADTLLVVADESFVTPLRERGVFEFGTSKLTGDPNTGFTVPVETRFLFEEIDADSREDQIAWLSDALDRLGHDGETESGQHALGDWSGDDRACSTCDAGPPETTLDAYNGTLYCPQHAPDQCSRCGGWTHETGHGSYPLCSDCQTEGGGQKRTPVERETSEQVGLADATRADGAARTDGGDTDSE